MPHPASIDIDPANPSRVLAVAETPLLTLGRPGTFDDSGITPVSILRSSGVDVMYYVGWKRRRYGVTIETSIGVATVLEGGNRLAKLFEGPILAQDTVHPLMVAAPFVIPSRGGFRMWYCSGTEWRQTPTGPEPVYSVCHADSEDGLRWRADGRNLLQAAGEGEVVSAPWVVRHAGGWLMWYSYRGSESPEAKRFGLGWLHLSMAGTGSVATMRQA